MAVVVVVPACCLSCLSLPPSLPPFLPRHLHSFEAKEGCDKRRKETIGDDPGFCTRRLGLCPASTQFVFFFVLVIIMVIYGLRFESIFSQLREDNLKGPKSKESFHTGSKNDEVPCSTYKSMKKKYLPSKPNSLANVWTRNFGIYILYIIIIIFYNKPATKIVSMHLVGSFEHSLCRILCYHIVILIYWTLNMFLEQAMGVDSFYDFLGLWVFIRQDSYFLSRIIYYHDDNKSSERQIGR